MILKLIDNPEFFAEHASTQLGVFGSLQWLSIYGSSITMIGIYKDDHQLIGGFYFMETKRYGASFIKLPPYTPHCGLFFNSESTNQSSRSNFSKEIMNEVVQYLQAKKASLTILAFPSNINDMQPFIWNKYKVVPNYTYRIDLKNPMDEIRSHFDSKNRNVINKAIKEGVQVEKNALGKEALYDFFVETLSKTDASVYKTELKHIFLKFSNHTNSFSLTATLNAQVLGTVFCIYDKLNCYYLLGGVHKQSGVGGVTNLLIQKSIEQAKELGCSVFDFEGSMLKGVEKFFRSFGPELIPYYTVNKAILPLELLLKFKKRELF